jgi:hypothetical protein
MKKNYNSCRRDFIKKSVLLTSGITFLNPGSELFGATEDEWRYIGFCTQACDNTCNYKKNGQCWTCKSTQGLNGKCEVKRCAIDVKNVPTCAHCDELETCDKEFWEKKSELKTKALELKESLNTTGTYNSSQEKADFQVFPNPAKDYVNIQYKEEKKAGFKIMDIQGKIIKKGQLNAGINKIELPDIPNGNYILTIIRNNVLIYTTKLIMNH